MKKLALIVAITGTLIACNDSADTTEIRQDSLDSIANEKKDVIDSTAEQRKDIIDSTTERKKDSLEKRDTSHKH